MSNRRFEMYEYRAVLVRMRQGDSDRAIARSGLMGRSKVRRFRALADFHGWLESGNPLPGEEEIVRVAPIRSCPQSTGSSSVEPYRAQVESWVREGIQVTTIQRALERIHGYRGSYSSVNRFVRGITLCTAWGYQVNYPVAGLLLLWIRVQGRFHAPELVLSIHGKVLVILMRFLPAVFHSRTNPKLVKQAFT